MIRIFVTDDHELYLEGICLLLNREPNMKVTGSCTSAKQLLATLPQLEADILILDVNLPDMEELDLLKTIRKQNPELKIIYLTMLRGIRYVHKLQKYNIQGYVLKNAPTSELREAIQKVMGGENYFSRELNIASQKDDFRNSINISETQVNEILSKREIEILRLICEEFSNAEIAEKLFLSVSTIETHRKKLISKLGVNNTVGLVKFALKNNLID